MQSSAGNANIRPERERTMPPSLLTIQFLKWVATRPRRYAEVQEAWKSTCPLNSAWEDALSDDLVAFDGAGESTARSIVILTARGRACLDRSG
jgi:hypothetical protein